MIIFPLRVGTSFAFFTSIGLKRFKHAWHILVEQRRGSFPPPNAAALCMSYFPSMFSLLFYAVSFLRVGNDLFLSLTMPRRGLGSDMSSLNAYIKINGAEAEHFFSLSEQLDTALSQRDQN